MKIDKTLQFEQVAKNITGLFYVKNVCDKNLGNYSKST